MSAEGQVIVVSGGSRGLGGAVVKDLLGRGHVVATFSRSSSPLVEECQRGPAKERFIWEAVDGTDHEAVKRFAFSVAKRFDRIDGLINNAAFLAEGLLALTPVPDIRKSLALNLESTILLTQTCVKVMLRQGGSIINISSLNGIRGHAGVSVYSATKAALDGFSRSLARELGPRKIRVNSVAPGYFESEMTGGMTQKQKDQILRRTPLGRLGKVEDLVGVIRFLLSPEAGFITGQTLVVDGGITC